MGMASGHSPSLRTRLVGMMALLFLGGMLVLYFAARAYSQTAADRSFDQLLSGSALSIAETLSISDRRVRVDLPYAALEMLSVAPDDRVFYRVYGPDSGTITGYDDMPLPPTAQAVLGSSQRSDPESVRYFNSQFRGEIVRFALLGREVAEPGVNGWIWVQVGQTRHAREDLAHELMLGALLPIGLITLLALVLVWVAVGRALSPLQRLGRELSDRGPSDLHPLSANVPAEIGPMVESLNGFMHRLSLNVDTLRAFIAEAAHQLRTPLAGLRAQAQMALAEDDPAEVRRGLYAVERNASKLSRLVNQLLSDATVMHRSDMPQLESFDLLDIVRKAMREVVPLAQSADVVLHADMQSAPHTGDGLMLCEAFKNLIDNALRYGDGEPVELKVDALKSGYQVSVCDRGPGIPAAERKRVFERFARGSNTRPGVGLGLAIVRRAVHSQGGDVELMDRDGGGLIVRVVLPGVDA